MRWTNVVLFVCLVTAGTLALPQVVSAATPTAMQVLSGADHSRFADLDKPFASGPEVTAACLKCHNRSGTQMLHSAHWRWQPEGAGSAALGKAHVINNF